MPEYEARVLVPFKSIPSLRHLHLYRAMVSVQHSTFGGSTYILEVFRPRSRAGEPSEWRRSPWVYQVRRPFWFSGGWMPGRVLFEGRARTMSSARTLALVEAKRAFGRAE